MEHREAVQTHASERYLLGEMAASERENFEDHFFDCAECAEEVRIGSVLKANLRAVFADEAAASWGRRGSSWASPAWAAAAALFLAVLSLAAYQNFWAIPKLEGQLAALRSPRSFEAANLLGSTRGPAPQQVTVSPSLEAVGLSIPMNTDWRYSKYRMVFSDGSTLEREAPRTGIPLSVLLFRPFPEGVARLTLYGLDESGPRELGVFEYQIITKEE